LASFDKKKKLTADKKRILELEKENSFLKSEIAYLKALVHELLQEIDRLKHPKNSRNSSVPHRKTKTDPSKQIV